MNCKEIKKEIFDYNFTQENTLDLPDHIRNHLSTCQECTKNFESQKFLIKELENYQAPSLSESHWKNIEDSIVQKIPTKKYKSKNQPINIIQFPKKEPFKLSYAIASVLILITGISTIFISRYTIENQNKALYLQVENSLPAAQINSLQGEVTIRSSHSKESKRATTKTILQAGDIITTAEKANLIFTTPNKSNIAISEKSEFSVNEQSIYLHSYQLSKGKVEIKVEKPKTTTLFYVTTPNAKCEVIGTVFSVDVNQIDKGRTKTILNVQEGTVKFTYNNQILFVKEGERAVYVDTTPQINLNTKQLELKVPTNENRKPIPQSLESPLTKGNTSDSLETIVGTLLQTKQCNDAFELLKDKKGKLTFSQNGSILLKMASCFRQQLQFAKAESIYTSLIANEKFSELHRESALFSRAQINYMNDNTINAISDLRRYSQDFPNGAYYNESIDLLYQLLKNQSLHHDAARVLKEYIRKRNAQNVDKYLYELGQIYVRDLKNYDEAINCFSTILKEYSSSVFVSDALFWRADCFYRSGKVSNAISEYRKYLERYPTGKWVKETETRLLENKSDVGFK